MATIADLWELGVLNALNSGTFATKYDYLLIEIPANSTGESTHALSGSPVRFEFHPFAGALRITMFVLWGQIKQLLKPNNHCVNPHHSLISLIVV